MQARFSRNFYGSAEPQDLSDMVFLFDLDGTITEPGDSLKVKFVPGAIEFMVKLHDQRAKIGIISHSCNKTKYSEAVLNKLAEMGITDIPYVSLYDVVIKALQTAKTEYDTQGNKFITLNQEQGVEFKIQYNSFNISADLIALKKQVDLIRVFGKGISHMMGSVALEKLKLTEQKCREMSICTVGDSITDITHAKILQEKYGFRQAFGFLLNATPEKQLFQGYFTNLLFRGSMPESMVLTACKMIELRCKGVSLVQLGQMPSYFSSERWHELSNKSKEVAAQTDLEINNAYARESVLGEEIEARASLVAEEVAVRTSLETLSIANRNTLNSTNSAGDETQTTHAELQAALMSRLSSLVPCDGSGSTSASLPDSNQGAQRKFARARTPILLSDSCDGSGSTSARPGGLEGATSARSSREISLKPKPRRPKTPIPLHRMGNWTSEVAEHRLSATVQQGQNCGSSTNI